MSETRALIVLAQVFSHPQAWVIGIEEIFTEERALAVDTERGDTRGGEGCQRTARGP